MSGRRGMRRTRVGCWQERRLHLHRTVPGARAQESCLPHTHKGEGWHVCWVAGRRQSRCWLASGGRSSTAAGLPHGCRVTRARLCAQAHQLHTHRLQQPNSSPTPAASAQNAPSTSSVFLSRCRGPPVCCVTSRRMAFHRSCPVSSACGSPMVGVPKEHTRKCTDASLTITATKSPGLTCSSALSSPNKLFPLVFKVHFAAEQQLIVRWHIHRAVRARVYRHRLHDATCRRWIDIP